MDKSSLRESLRQTDRMFHALRQRQRLLDLSQRPVGMAKVDVTPGRTLVGEDANIASSPRVCQRPMLAGIV